MMESRPQAPDIMTIPDRFARKISLDHALLNAALLTLPQAIKRSRMTSRNWAVCLAQYLEQSPPHTIFLRCLTLSSPRCSWPSPPPSVPQV